MYQNKLYEKMKKDLYEKCEISVAKVPLYSFFVTTHTLCKTMHVVGLTHQIQFSSIN